MFSYENTNNISEPSHTHFGTTNDKEKGQQQYYQKFLRGWGSPPFSNSAWVDKSEAQRAEAGGWVGHTMNTLLLSGVAYTYKLQSCSLSSIIQVSKAGHLVQIQSFCLTRIYKAAKPPESPQQISNKYCQLDVLLELEQWHYSVGGKLWQGQPSFALYISFCLTLLINQSEMKLANANRICLAANIRLCPFLLLSDETEKADYFCPQRRRFKALTIIL